MTRLFGLLDGYKTHISAYLLILLGAAQEAGVLDLSTERLTALALMLIGLIGTSGRHALAKASRPAPPEAQ